MHQERRSNGTHQSYFADYNGFTVNPEQVNSAYLKSTVTQKYGDYLCYRTKIPKRTVTIGPYCANDQALPQLQFRSTCPTNSIVTKKSFVTSNVQVSLSLHHVIGPKCL